MPITILGSWPEAGAGEFAPRGSRDEFERACRDLGRELARKKQQILVGNDSSSSADYHVVTGYLDVAEVEDPPYPLIHVIRPETGDLLFGDSWRQRGGLFTSHLRTQRSPEGAKIISVYDADAVFAIGGAEGTYRAGLTAIVARKTLVPISSFGGAALHLLDAVGRFPWVKNSNEFGSLYGPWQPYVLEKALRLSGITKPPRLLIIHGRSDDRRLLKEWLEEDVGLSPSDVVIMGEEPGKGRTLPEKWEDLASDVDAAIAIATPDDKGGLATEAPSDYEPRARENVWLEVGWFWGRLGRDKVMLLRKGEIEPPTDLKGFEYHSYREAPPGDAQDHVREFIRRLTPGA